ncbi:MAG: helix-turn-helix domain-containing protein, partial [Gaiellaceae bacterium]
MTANELSSLGVARARRRLTVEEVAERAGLSPEAVEALEESRLYRFPSLQEAVAAAVLYSAALGISQREARRLAGLPVRDHLFASLPLARIGAPIAFAVAVALLA